MTHSHPDLNPRRLSLEELPLLAGMATSLGLNKYFNGDALLNGSDPIIRSPHRLGEASGIAQLLIGMAGAAIWNTRTGISTDVSIDIVDALHFLHPTHYVAQQGRPINVGAEHVAVNDLFLCRDGRYVMLEAGPPYPKLLDGYLNFFDCGNNKESIAREVAKWDSEALEAAMAEAGLPACRAFTREEWLAHPQGRELQASPVIEIEKISDGPVVPFAPFTGANSPLQGFRVLDFTHVLAGPRSARTLAEYGADVLHISSPSYPDTHAQHLGVDVGKRCAYLDLRDSADLAAMLRLSAHADVFTTSYRRGVNARFGLLPEQLAERNTRGIVCLTVNAYGHSGPWAERPGFDQNGQVATGFAVREGLPGKPRFSPVFYLADLITGYLAAAGMMAALLRRSIEGGSYHVKLSLARSAMWVQEMGLLDVSVQGELPSNDNYPAKLVAIQTPYGSVAGLQPPLQFSAMKLPAAEKLEPYGASAATWLDRQY
ncbi:CoA transferase [Paraburkholderia graminis]|uniref:CoA transferase n=1 Tax=Paraburkholderia graminis TaxID=60548 RepID=UPI00278CA8AF|nr:CoA transferase [Paraburkholderia graminis]MDQ0625978.1 crotonobetainyl-CoA:carnitine CoA-transferase CaiB-like acyl-CoA transferase [Paraburkholderia graminis]